MQVVSLSRMISQWTLDGAADLLGANPLTNVNSVPGASGLFGKQCAQLTRSSSQKFTAGDAASLQIGGVSFAWAAWFNPTSVPGATMGLVMKGQSLGNGIASQHEYGLNLLSTGALNFRGSNGSSSLTVSTGNASTFGAWNLIIFWVDTSIDQKLRIQLNGGAAAASASAPSGGVWNGGGAGFGLSLGYSNISGADDYYNGLLGPVSFWKRALTATERALLWNGGLGLPSPWGYDQPSLFTGGMNDLVGGLAS